MNPRTPSYDVKRQGQAHSRTWRDCQRPTLLRCRSEIGKLRERSSLIAPRAFAATAPAASAAVPTPTGAWSALFAWPGDIDGEIPAFKGLAIEALNSSLGFFFGGHRDKGEAPGFACGTVRDKIHIADDAIGGEHVLQIIFSGFERNVPDEQSIIHAITEKESRSFRVLVPTGGPVQRWRNLTKTYKIEMNRLSNSHLNIDRSRSNCKQILPILLAFVFPFADAFEDGKPGFFGLGNREGL